MMKKEAAFWDASAIVPLCLQQSATPAAISHLRKFPLVVWWGSLVEVQSAICRLRREDAISDGGKLAAVARLDALRRTWREISPVDELRERALELLSRYPLKAADSFQLAASLVWCDSRPARRRFVCADQKLSIVARSAGFGVIELL